MDFIIKLLCSCCCNIGTGVNRGVGCFEAVSTCFVYYKIHQCCSYISNQITKCCTWTNDQIKSCCDFICLTSTEVTQNNHVQNSNIINSNNNIPIGIIVNPIESVFVTNDPDINLIGALPTNSEQTHSDDW